jgi:hypothetical protein
VTYELTQGEVVTKDEAGRVRWRGKPDGHPATAIMPLPGSSDAVILLDYMTGPKNFANLIRITPGGSVLWRAQPPEVSTNDAYVEVRWRGDALIANSWSGYLVQIDLTTGKPTSSEFVK